MAKIMNNKGRPKASVPDDDFMAAEEMPASIGSQLRKAREARKTSVSVVAEKLNLTKSVVDNLEADAWDKLNGRTYARGYLKSYANFLGLPTQGLLDQFDQAFKEDLPPLKARRNQRDRGGYAQQRRRRHFPWGKLIFSGLVMLAAWFAYQQWPNMKAAVIGQIGLETNSTDVEVSDDVGTASQQTALANTAEQIGNNQVTTLTLPTLTTETAVTANEVDENQRIATAEAVETAIPVQQHDPMQATLALAFSDVCWVEVKDATGKILMNDTKQKGDQIVLIGKSPLQISLGDASSVKVRFNGALFNTKPFTNRGGVARFDLNNKQL